MRAKPRRRRTLYGVAAPALYRLSRIAGLQHVRRRQRLVVREVAVPLGLGIRVVLFADLHADPDFLPQLAMRALVERVNDIPDVAAVLMPGDFAGHDLDAVQWCADELAALEAPAFATLGNHDLMVGRHLVTSALAGAGVRVLTNTAAQLADDIWIGGLDSSTLGRPDANAMRAQLPEGARAIVLGHEPRLALAHDELLHVAGHTHHGQIKLPFVPRYLPRHSRPYWAGLYELVGARGRRFVYTTAGVGATTIPLRIGAPPEVVVLDL